ncbi:type VI secretion system baseplate subunit TssF [Aliarcobacter skirrowii]|uniref:type VI secretion system baseplate subunit TssF n=1 Tax=Aliarcobacter skirrowii TaxID=28200 RepID=UPI0029A5DB61|nr:type VI secretion system baseplate subunit TssF [Aliarcobacter skirrowii]MDX4028671.1 type VI secretion system baseplate subunit TssF [Aliarcobacter skirrowii]
MIFNDYYKKELISLRTKGLEFSKNNPGLSSYLSKEGQDPDVERLLEGFAFLSGSLNQLLDQELPEVAHTLVQILWPDYNRVIPSYSIIQYAINKESNETIFIPKNSEVMSKVKPNVKQCNFRTVYDTEILPIDLQSVEYFSNNKKSSIELDFKATGATTLLNIKIEKLRLFLNGSKYVVYDLYLYLLKYVENISIMLKDINGEILKNIIIDKSSIKAVGLDDKDYMLPYSESLFSGYILLQEYFCFRDKFLFIDLLNLSKMKMVEEDILDKSKSFTIKIGFSKTFTNQEIPTKDNFILNATPIINIFNTDAVPIKKDFSNDEYLIEPIELTKEQGEVFSVENVRAWSDKTSSYQDMLPFEEFEHSAEGREFYSIKTKTSNQGDRTNSYIRFSNVSRDNVFSNISTTVSLKLLCTNRNIPTNLRIGDICIPKIGVNSVNTPFKNITVPTISYPPPIAKDFLWKIISNMSLNYLSLADINTLRRVLAVYDFYGAYDLKQREINARNLEGLVSIDYSKCEYIDEGFPIKGHHIKIKLDKSKFSTLGEAYLFCTVINEFFSLYGSLNSFHRLSVEVLNEDTFEWPIKIGSKMVI